MKDEYLHRTQQKAIVLERLRFDHGECLDSEVAVALQAEIHEMEKDLLHRKLRIHVAYTIEGQIGGRFMTGIGQVSDGGVRDGPYVLADSILEAIKEYQRKLGEDES